MHVQAKVTVDSLRRMNTSIRGVVQTFSKTMDSVNFEKLNTSWGKLYNNKADIKRAILFHASAFLLVMIHVDDTFSRYYCLSSEDIFEYFVERVFVQYNPRFRVKPHISARQYF